MTEPLSGDGVTPLSVGDAVTVVAKGDASFTLVKRVTGVPTQFSGFFYAEIDPGVSGVFTHNSVLYRLAHEGVTWIRGAHRQKSPEVQAMLVAYAVTGLGAAA